MTLHLQMTPQDQSKIRKIFAIVQRGTEGEANAAKHALQRFAQKYQITSQQLIDYLQSTSIKNDLNNHPQTQHTTQTSSHYRFEDLVDILFRKEFHKKFYQAFSQDNEDIKQHKQRFEERKKQAHQKNPEKEQKQASPSYSYYQTTFITQKDKERLVMALLKDDVPIKRIQEHIPISCYEIARIFLKNKQASS